MSDTFAKVNVRILEKEYQVSCPVDERAALLDADETVSIRLRNLTERVETALQKGQQMDL